MTPKNKPTDVLSTRHNVRLPGFITEETIGLGDLIKRTTYLAGIKPCGGCERRAKALNRWLAFGPKKG
ncbi:MAG: hypothetical protein M3Y57_16850 [Acidobacteriota bacterium]|nr:hypothetical protein [Acidobacteriota bacterium]